MRNRVLFSLFFSLFSIIIFSQSEDISVKAGDFFVIGEPLSINYKHINFPKPHMIIKRGGIANYKNVKGKKVEVTSIKQKKDGSLLATIRLTSKKFFFNSHKYTTADILEAIRQKELLRI